MSVGWFYDPLFLRHDSGPSHVESAARLVAIVRSLERDGLLSVLQHCTFRAATPELLELVHDPAYVSLVRMMCDEGFGFIGAEDTRICP